MIELSASDRQAHGQAPLASIERPIDLVHLARMTLGDRSLEREMLQLFDRQALTLMMRIRQLSPGPVAAVAHALKGSARSIGAWRVACAAEAVELGAQAPADFNAGVDRLGMAVDEARTVIAELLRAN